MKFKFITPLLLLLFLLLIILFSERISFRDLHKLRRGQSMYFSCTDLEGKNVSIASYRGKVILINFWATWCPYCRKERTELRYLHRNYGDRGLVIISIAQDRSLASVRKYIQNNHADFIVCVDTDGDISNALGVRGLPTNFLMDRSGVVRKKFIGYRRWSDPAASNELRNMLER